MILEQTKSAMFNRNTALFVSYGFFIFYFRFYFLFWAIYTPGLPIDRLNSLITF